jgi:hypothetical protein
MSLQTFINSAQGIEVARADLVATSVSRSGRLITQTRNTVKPWTFKVTPQQVMSWSAYRGAIEAVLTADRHTEHQIQIGATVGSSWLTAYQGNCPKNSSTGILDYVYVTAFSGNTITINVANAGIPDGTVIFQPGDIVQPAGTGTDGLYYRYPYAVTEAVVKNTGDTTKVVKLNRGCIVQANYDVTSGTSGRNSLKVGTACTWRVIMTNLPAMRYIPGQLVEFTGEMELLEVVL